MHFKPADAAKSARIERFLGWIGQNYTKPLTIHCTIRDQSTKDQYACAAGLIDCLASIFIPITSMMQKWSVEFAGLWTSDCFRRENRKPGEMLPP